MKDRRRKRREKHLCISCGTKAGGKAYCTECSASRSRRQSITTQERKTQGLCIQCNNVVIDGKSRCFSCREPFNIQRKNRRKAWVERGLCYCCGNTTSGKKACKSCLAQHKNFEQKRKKLLIDADLCCRCGRFPPLHGITKKTSKHTLCQICYIKSISQVNLGSGKYAATLLTKLKAQNYRCPHTGDNLVLGDNTWLDHIMPRSRFPELAHDIDNVEWVTETVNRMKQDQTPDEFLALIKQIHDYNSL